MPPISLPHFVVCLSGGSSPERDISLKTGLHIQQALSDLGIQWIDLDPKHPHWISKLCSLKEQHPQLVVYNALHGGFGEDGHIPALCNLLKLPYTHSGYRSSMLAMDKSKAKLLAQSLNIPTIPGISFTIPSNTLSNTHQETILKHILNNPFFSTLEAQQGCFIKPNYGGSSIGVHALSQTPTLEDLKKLQPGTYLCEQLITGRELSIGVLEQQLNHPKSLFVTEIIPEKGLGFYDYTAKYALGGSRHLLPATIQESSTQILLQAAQNLHAHLGCKTMSRSDFILSKTTDGSEQVYYLETNTHPGMTQTSLINEQAQHAGITLTSLIRLLLNQASFEQESM